MLYYEGDGKVLAAVSEVLGLHGYSSNEWSYSKDGGPGWTGWWYWIEIKEDPARPVADAIAAALQKL